MIPARAVLKSARKGRLALCYTKETRTHPKMQDRYERARSVKQLYSASHFASEKGTSRPVIAILNRQRKKTSRNSSD
ncbi:hypothetical protein HBI56_009410 [Parastagonospora nodorum]|uniref:Uncharacterized protein n=1 Tax=Phaeosphaeria nodorum (strain SN15 / ATCC MYA-4574 / FGSC 10173) TaxID=321614 RepID=A0A7U2HW65_PHANO|nr:hypothetical protein HBH56_012320 [Parastagonospora nodorum]QRC90886.1 hypothetical protein JI435_400680 [Parastagonospora nodorum SN15]KAH3935007.1 hypothetical protein HBH54_045620 [Parastagonospora nodorum]KAH3950333.1 hypothetical protein HBH53_078110 [Parastagonospora nodorum]KAH3986765.1 hypothetical protein HBH51_011160 [Parastagonospora nodorum]